MSLVDFVDELKKLVKEQIHNIHTALPAEIVSIDETTGRVCVKPKAQMRFSNGRIIDFPLISGVPLVMPQSGIAGAAIVFPVKSGDQCLLVFSEQSLDYWLENGMTNSHLKFSLSNAIAIPGLMRSVSEDIKTANQNDAIIIKNNNTQIMLSKSVIAMRGDVKIDGNLFINGDFISTTDENTG